MIRILSCVCIILLWATTLWANHDRQEDACHAAQVVGCENFESRSLGNMMPGTNVLQAATYKNLGWDTAYNRPDSPVVVDNAHGGVFSGNRALEIHCLQGANVCSAKAILHQAANCYPTCYVRWYEKWSSNYVFAPVGTKNTMPVNVAGWGLHTLQNSYGSISNYVTGGERPQPCNPPVTTSQPCDDSINYFRNIMSPAVPGTTTPGVNNYFQGGQWFCMETRTTINSAQHSFDGIMEAWINGTKILNYTTVNIYSQTANLSAAAPYTEWWVEGYWNCESSVQPGNDFYCNNQAQVPPPGGDYHPEMRKWIDNIVISSAPIGCISGTPPPPDPTPPKAR